MNTNVRLKVAYKTPQSLVGEYTRSVGQGGVTLETRKALPLGTRFTFELHAGGMPRPVEVLGEVVKVEPRPGERFMLTVRYDGAEDRSALDAVLQFIFAQEEQNGLRRFPRLPLHLRAREADPRAPFFYVRDISRGGVGLEVDAPALPREVLVGTPFFMEMDMKEGPLLLHGEVAWTSSVPRKGVAQAVTPGFGATFGRLRPDMLQRLEALMALEHLPPAPWRARVSFGLEAVSRMP
ncbi:pilus assembly protein PilZ [Corallococcus sp. AB004]|uniref:PilZ domain-containing protein n=1 Tax=Corallococcus TaxID=83461 RepID=UPI000EA17EF9|nr:PilZ domain-containing protein [Corallococcus sp. AB038B]NPC68635.1 pilus assembly protein PilZ [Corallococcus exiguus]RKI47171.1 pilus assembly protein PilZ [Corallococcus sp. AB004]NPD23248.1 pilus assembly protein PilZ [Corallococcus exiguus]NRD48118.1 PilZ domain-containing protein [Corallococcus exiguus]RKH98896.1 pilus assembly protein PilZ [Corallococcus sp. AB038B]